MKAKRHDWLPTRQSLLSRLRHWDDQESWRDFFYTYWKLIYGAARKVGLSDLEAQEVVQETVIRVAQRIEQFRYDPQRGSFKGWLLGQTRKGIERQFQQRHKEESTQSWDVISSTDGDCQMPEWAWSTIQTTWDQEWEENLMDVAITRVKQKANLRQFQIFNLYVMEGMSASKVAQVLEINVALVYLAKHRITKLIRREYAAFEANYF